METPKQSLARRVHRIERIIIAEREPDSDDENDEIVIIDLLSDLRHYCRRFHYDFDKLDGISAGHFVAELACPD
jgi:hypothetical protein